MRSSRVIFSPSTLAIVSVSLGTVAQPNKTTRHARVHRNLNPANEMFFFNSFILLFNSISNTKTGINYKEEVSERFLLK